MFYLCSASVKKHLKNIYFYLSFSQKICEQKMKLLKIILFSSIESKNFEFLLCSLLVNFVTIFAQRYLKYKRYQLFITMNLNKNLIKQDDVAQIAFLL